VSLELVGESFCKAAVEYFSQRSSGGTATLQDIRLILVDDNAANTTRHSFVQYAERSGWLECSRRLSTGSAASLAISGGSMPTNCSKPMDRSQLSGVEAYEGGVSVGNSNSAGGFGGFGMQVLTGVSKVVPGIVPIISAIGAAMPGHSSSGSFGLARGDPSPSPVVSGHGQAGFVPRTTSGHSYGGSPYPSTSSHGGQPPYSSTSGHGEFQHLPTSDKGGSPGGNGSKTSGSSSRSTDQPGGAASSDDMCVICFDSINNPKKLPCGHVFCKECIDEQSKYQPKCPSCGKLFGTPKGNQPPNGTMKHSVMHHIHLAGYPGCGTIEITYNFPNGVQRVRANV
jgi:hypothetical protein